MECFISQLAQTHAKRAMGLLRNLYGAQPDWHKRHDLVGDRRVRLETARGRRATRYRILPLARRRTARERLLRSHEPYHRS